MPAGKQGGDFSPIIQLPPISNVNNIAIVGDIDITSDTKKVINKMKQAAQILFLNGDFSYSEDEQDTRKWFSKLFGDYSGKILGSLGNHDLGLSEVYKNLFNQNQWTYSIDIENIHFLVLNTQRWKPGEVTTKNEIILDLEQSIQRGMRFIVVLQHVPLKGHVKIKSNYYYVKKSSWEEAYKIKKVELIISGHVHNYQRFPKNTDGNIYLTVGTGGAQPTVLQSTSGLEKYFKNKYGYLMIENIGQELINARFYDKNGNQLDLFSIGTNR
jgi:calcineurin-like phosphoesterase family protein